MIQRPNLKYRRWGFQRAATAARRAARRRARGKHGGWLNGMPTLRTDKAATRNNGRAPYFECNGRKVDA